MANFGWSFNPGASEPMGGGPARTNGTPNDPVQEAIQILTLRLPKRYGAHAIAPAPLMQGRGGMGQPGARGDVTAQAFAMLAGVPMQSVSAPTFPSSRPNAPMSLPSPVREERRVEERREEPRSYQPGDYLTPVEARERGVSWRPQSSYGQVPQSSYGQVRVGAGGIPQ